MIAVIQRVDEASVTVDGEVVGSCGQGLYVLLGVGREDSERDADALVRKIINLRIFEDESGKMNLSVLDVGGEMLAVSNFTLLASYRKGNRPDYMGAASPDVAKPLYDYFCSKAAESVKVAKGVFGADMKPHLACNGPVTIVMDSKVLIG